MSHPHFLSSGIHKRLHSFTSISCFTAFTVTYTLLNLSGGKNYYHSNKHAMIDMYANSNIQIMQMMSVFNSGMKKK
jgi:hypothetical protein